MVLPSRPLGSLPHWAQGAHLASSNRPLLRLEEGTVDVDLCQAKAKLAWLNLLQHLVVCGGAAGSQWWCQPGAPLSYLPLSGCCLLTLASRSQRQTNSTTPIGGNTVAAGKRQND